MQNAKIGTSLRKYQKLFPKANTKIMVANGWKYINNKKYQ